MAGRPDGASTATDLVSGGQVGTEDEIVRIRAGGSPAAHEKAAAQGKLFCRARIDLLVEPGSFVEDGLFANAAASGLPADGLVIGTALDIEFKDGHVPVVASGKEPLAKKKAPGHKKAKPSKKDQGSLF